MRRTRYHLHSTIATYNCYNCFNIFIIHYLAVKKRLHSANSAASTNALGREEEGPLVERGQVDYRHGLHLGPQVGPSPIPPLARRNPTSARRPSGAVPTAPPALSSSLQDEELENIEHDKK